MPFELLEEVAIADACYKLTGNTLEEIFESGFHALIECIVNPASVKAVDSETIELTEQDLEKLLYSFLDELVYKIDTESKVYCKCEVQVTKNENNSGYSLRAAISGEHIDYEKHEMHTDVKAVTYYQFFVKKTSSGWEARVTFDL
ncbi:MAG: archease [Candidatus Hodarchaeales archaeon]